MMTNIQNLKESLKKRRKLHSDIKVLKLILIQLLMKILKIISKSLIIIKEDKMKLMIFKEDKIKMGTK